MGEHPPAVHPRLRHDPGALQPVEQRPTRLRHLPGPARLLTRSAPRSAQPRVYFGLNNPNGGDVNYVLGDTRQPEIDYPAASTRGTPCRAPTRAAGGCSSRTSSSRPPSPSGSSDFNLLVSDLVTSQSRLMFVRDITQMAQKAAPFLSYDSDPYPVLSGGQIYWVLDAYTTSDNYPYSQNVDTSSLPANSGLNQNLNYVRNSVKVVVNAYTGQDDLLRRDRADQDEGPDPPDLGEGLPRHVHPGVADARGAAGPPPLPRGPAHGPGRHVRPLPHHQAPGLLQRHQRLERLAERRVRVAGPGAAHHPDDQRPGQRRVHRPGRPDGAASTSCSRSRADARSRSTWSTRSSRCPRATRSRPCPASSWPGPTRASTASSRCSRRRPIDGPALVDADIAATQAISSQISLLNQNGSSVQLGNAAGRPGRRLDALLPAVLRAVVAQPVPQARLLHRRLQRTDRARARSPSTPRLPAALQDLFSVSLPGPGHPGHADADRPVVGEPARPEPDRPGQLGLPAGADRPEERQLRRLRHRHHHPPGRAPAAPAGLGEQLAAPRSRRPRPSRPRPPSTTTSTSTSTTVPNGVALRGGLDG